MKNTSYKNNIDIYHGIQILKKYKLLLIYSFVIIFTFSLLYIIFSPKLYRSYISIYRVESGSGMSNSLGNLQGIASTFGFNFGGANNSSFYIPDVINTHKQAQMHRYIEHLFFSPGCCHICRVSS